MEPKLQAFGAEDNLNVFVGERVAGGQSDSLQTPRLAQVDLFLRQSVIVQFAARSGLPGSEIDQLPPRHLLGRHSDRLVEKLIDAGADRRISFGRDDTERKE